jgi:tetratricopeptide (TPR) repeat protein
MKSSASPENLLNAYLTAVQEAMNNIPLELMKKEKIISLENFVTIGKYLVYSGFYIENINILLYGCSIYNSASLCYLLGLSYLRLERVDEAEDCFMEGNVLDNRHVDIWSYLCMVCIMKGIHRLPEAESCMFQALRLGQNDPTILRELATSFMSVDKLQIAEDLIRRTIAIEISNNANRKPNATTRKLLADILAGQNMAVKAIDEYKLLLVDDHLDWDSKLMIAEKCSNLLGSLGREEEIQSLKNIMENIKSENYQ